MRIESSEIKPKLDLLESIATPNAIIPVYEDLRIGYSEGLLTLEVANGFSHAKTSVHVEGNPERFYRTVSCQKFSKLIKAINEPYIFIDIQDEKELKINSNNGSFSIACSDWKDFTAGRPLHKEYQEIDLFKFVEAVKKVSWAASKEMPLLKNVGLAKNIICSASTSVFAICESNAYPDTVGSIPIDAVPMIKSLPVQENCMAKYSIHDGYMVFDFDGYEVGVLLSATKYPDLKAHLKEELPPLFDVSRLDLKSALTRMRILTESDIVRLEVRDKAFYVSGVDTIQNNKSVERVLSGVKSLDLNIIVNAKNLFASMSHLGDDITLRYLDGKTYITLESEGFLVVLTAIVQ